MLAAAELRAIAERFGVDDQQVRRDHLISHVLAAIGAAAGESVIFFGGTALVRGVLVQGRLSDAPPTTLTVLTSAGFVAAKTAAWHDRRAARDLWDLWALAEGGHLTDEAADLYATVGPARLVLVGALVGKAPGRLGRAHVDLSRPE